MTSYNAIDIVLSVKKQGIGISLNTDQLQLQVPQGQSVDPQLLELIRANKGLLIDYLRSERLTSTADQVQKIAPRESRSQKVPLAFSQERLWLIDQVEGSVQYHIPQVLRIRGGISIDSLSSALQEIVNRHEVLRTVIRQENGTPYQHVLEKGQWKMDRSIAETMDDARGLQQQIRSLISQPFDLGADHMLRAHLIQLKQDEYILVVVIHHIASDGWSLPILVDELLALYKALDMHAPADLKPLPVQYADYAVWQRQNLATVLAKKLEFWLRQLEGVVPLNLPTDFPRPAVQSTRGSSLSFQFDNQLASALRSLCQRTGATLYMTMLAGFKVLMHRYSGQTDICVGSPIAGRQQPELEGLIGFFVNTLALRTMIAPDMTFTALLQRVREATLNAYDHQEVPFDKVVSAIYKDRDISRSPVFQVEFILQNTTRPKDITLGDVLLSYEDFEKTTAKFDLSFSIEETPAGLTANIEYCADLFHRDTIRRLADHYQQLLRTVAEDPEQRIRDLEFLSARERHQLIYEFNNTARNYCHEKTLVNLFAEQVERTPDAIATVFEDQRLTYRMLDERSNQVAHYLKAKGVEEGALVPLCIDRGNDMIIAILAILKAGAAYVPIDPEYPRDRIVYMLEDTQASLIVSNAACREKVAGASIISMDEERSTIGKQSKEILSTAPEPGHLAYVIYTSGSTGRPKGVMIEHRGIVNRLNWAQEYYNLTAEDVVLQKTTFCFDVSVWELLWPLLAGSRLVFARPGAHKDNEYLKQIIEREGITMLHFVPPMLEAFLADVNPGDCLPLKKVLCSGEALKMAHVSLFREKLPYAELHNLYGPTEASVDVTYWSLQDNEEDLRQVPIGKPVANTYIYILDATHKLLPVGCYGELYIGGVQLARGYLNKPELTQERFLADPFRQEQGARIYRTGDIARWLTDGNIEYLGRADNQVKIRGYRIELGEIESAMDSLGIINTSCVVVDQDETVNRLVAFYVPDEKEIRLKESEFFKNRIDSWTGVYDEQYLQDGSDAEFNLTGWTDSFSAKPIPAEEMKLWLEDIAGVILSEKPQYVLEIGCGTGLVYYKLAKHVQKYTGTDISASVINRLRDNIGKDNKGHYPVTDLKVCAAHEIMLPATEDIDTIILNSVVQYFPGEDYLSGIIEKSISLLQGNGRIIIGDVRDYRLLRAFKCRTMLDKFPGDTEIRELQWIVDQEVMRENELCVSPDYFYGLKSKHPEITHIDIQWKQGDYDNELILYRYAVIIHVGISRQRIDPRWQSWDVVNTGSVEAELTKGDPLIAISNVPNTRLWREEIITRSFTDGVLRTAHDLVQRLATAQIDTALAVLIRKALAHGYQYKLVMNADPLKVDLVLTKGGLIGFINTDYAERSQRRTEVTNIPLLQDISAMLKSEIRKALQQALPEYMVPWDFMAVKTLPLTSNGKVDRKFLGQQGRRRHTSAHQQLPLSATELHLASVWQDILGIPVVGIHDNFFELGGDSIISIQVVSRMKRLGYDIRPKDIFLNQTIAKLALALEDRKKNVIVGEQGQLMGRSPLAPIQQRYLSECGVSVSHFNQSALLGIDKSVAVGTLNEIVKQLTRHHDALRLIFSRKDKEWVQEFGAREEELTIENLSLFPVDSWTGELERRANYYQQSLSVEKGKLIRAVYIETPVTEKYNRLLLIVHHLAVDGVSWRILLEDIENMLAASAAGKDISLGQKGTSYREWCNQLTRYSETQRLNSQLGYWVAITDRYSPLPVDKNQNDLCRIKEVKTSTFRLSADDTLKLLREAPKAYHTEVNDILLCALAMTLCKWSGSNHAFIGLEGHGREDGLFSNVDTSRTVGWFTSLYPVLLRIDSAGSVSDHIKSVKEQMRAIPDKGLGYGVLKYISRRERLAKADPWDIIFNYLGYVDNVKSQSGLLTKADEAMGQSIDGEHAVSEKFMLNCRVQDSRLVFDWSYSTRHYEDRTVKLLAEQYAGHLKDLILHCEQRSKKYGGVFTPSDFGLTHEVPYEALDAFMQEPVNGQPRGNQIERLYRLSGLQEGMMFHGLYDASGGTYVEQFNFDVLNLKTGAFLESWEHLIKSHSILRTSFWYEAFRIPVQCVHKNVVLPVVFLDYSDLPAEKQRQQIKEYQQEDRRKGFDFKTPPLMRLTLIKLDSRRYRVLWTHHHMILDGWSMPVVISELLAYYEALVTGKAVSQKSDPDHYEDYIRYLENRDQEKEEQHWRDYLAGVDAGTILPFISHSVERNKTIGDYRETSLVVDKETTSRITRYAHRHRVTLNTIVQGVWSYLLYRYTGQTSVVFGAVVSGRPDDLRGVEQRIGLYINTVPVKVTFDEGQAISTWLQSVQQDQIQNREHQHTTLTDIQKWTGIAGELFDNILVFENYPVSKVLASNAWQLQIENAYMQEQTNYPLTILVGANEEISIRFCYNADLLDTAYVAQVRKHFETVLYSIVNERNIAISDIELFQPEERHQLVNEFNGHAVHYGGNRTLTSLFEDQASKTPDQVAILFNEESLTYRQLRQQSNQLAHYLRSKGVGIGSLVPVCVERSLEMVVGILGVLKAGAAYVPIDPNYPEDRIALILEDTQATVFVATEETVLRKRSGLDIVYVERYEDYRAFPDDSPVLSLQEGHVACIIYTSGSSGRPKGVKLHHEAICNRLYWMWNAYPFEARERSAIKTSLAFVDHIWELFGPLNKGVPSVIFTRDDVVDLDVFIEKLVTAEITRLVLVPSLLSALLTRLRSGDVKLQKLKYWTCSGEVLASRIIEDFYSVFPIQHHTLLNIYGSTEVMADVTCYDTAAKLRAQMDDVSSMSLLEISVRREIEDLIDEFDNRPEIIRADRREVLGKYSDVSIAKNLSPEQYIDFLRNDLLPGIVNVSRPGYVGHMTGIVPQFIRDLNSLMVTLNQNLVKVETSYVASLLERQVLGIVHKQVYKFKDSFYDEHTQNPESCLGVITSGGTISNITALSYALRKALAARHEFRGIAEEGLVNSLLHYNYNGIVVIGSSRVHYSVGKALQILGIGKSGYVPFDFDKRNIEKSREEIEQKIESLQKNRVLVLAIIGVAGSTETGHIDPLDKLGKTAAKYGIHFHVDGAFGGAFIFSAALSNKLRGIEYADSVTICGHKQMLLPMGASICSFKSPHFASYSENNTHYQARKGSHDIGRYTIEGSRSFIALLFHSTLKILGAEKLGALLEENYGKTLSFAEKIAANDSFQLLETPELNIIIYRYIPFSLRRKIGKTPLSQDEISYVNEVNRRLQRKQFLRGKSFVSYTEIASHQGDSRVDRIVVLRSVVMNPLTTDAVFDQMLMEQIQTGDEIADNYHHDPDGPAIFAAHGDQVMSKTDAQKIIIGKPIPNTRVYVINAQGKLCPAGVFGELCVGGVQVAKGYLNLPELTQSKFVEDPFAEQPYNKMYRTGDLGRWLPDGNLEYLGRMDDQVKIRGYRIELGEIETVLLETEWVEQAVVVARSDRRGETRLIAYVKASGSFNKVAILAYCKRKLPDYMVPNVVEILSFPVTATGKIDKRALPDPDMDHNACLADAAPTNAKEVILASIWKDLLGRNRVGVNENFFEIGGHSLLATRVVSAVRRELQQELSIRDFFVNPTVRQLTALLQGRQTPRSGKVIAPRNRPERIPLSYGQERLWVIDQLEGSVQYHLPSVVRLKGNLDREVLASALRKLVNRHEALRTVFIQHDGSPYQQALREGLFQIDVTDNPDIGENALQDYIRDCINKPFDLSKDHPLRANLIPIGHSENILVIVLHHIAADGWSVPIIIRELRELYRSTLMGKEPDLNILTFNYPDYALWQRDYLQGETLNEKIKYWQNKLKGTAPLNIPTDYQRPAVQSMRGAAEQFVLESAVVDGIRQLSQRQGATLFMTLLTACKVLLYRYSGQDDICVGSPVAGRNYKEFEDMVGYFVNTIVLRSDLSGKPSFIDLLHRVKETTLLAFEYQDVPFDKVVDAVVRERDSSRTPIFQVLFDYQRQTEDAGEIFEGIGFTAEPVRHETAKFDLVFSIAERNESIQLTIEYCTDLFNRGSILKMGAHVQQLLSMIIEAPGKSISELEFSPSGKSHARKLIDQESLFDFK